MMEYLDAVANEDHVITSGEVREFFHVAGAVLDSIAEDLIQLKGTVAKYAQRIAQQD
jgi:hypothetical protein